MFRLKRSRDDRVVIGLHFGRFDLDQLRRELDRAYRTEILVPGIDCAIAFDKDFDCDDVTLPDLLSVSGHVAALDLSTPQSYRSVLIVQSQAARAVAEVFKASWVARPDVPQPEYILVDSLSEAGRIVGIADLDAEIGTLRPPTGVRLAV